MGAAAALSMQILGAALSLAVSLLLAKLIGATGLGFYFLAVTSVEICATIARLGLDNAALKFISIANDSDERGAIATLYRKCVGIAALSATVMILPALAILRLVPVGASNHGEFLSLIPFAMAALIPVTVLAVQAEAFKAIGYPGTAVFSQAVLPQGTLLLLSAFLAWQSKTTIVNILASYAASFLFVMFFALLRWATIIKEVWRRTRFPAAILLRSSLPILAVTSLNLVMAWTDTLVLGIWSDTNQVGIYGVALRIASTSTFILIAINSVVAPQFAALYFSGRHSELELMAQRGAFWAFVIASPLIMSFIIFPSEILGLFGEQFVAGAWPLRLLALSQLVNVATGQLASLLIMTGHEKWMRNNMMFSAALNLGANLLLAPLLGALGAAISTATCLSLMNIIAWWLARQKLQINTLDYLNLYSSGRPGPK
jgi:O-antigen/teichoic acid export membrane protein